MWKIWIEDDRVHVGERFVASFQRTLRIPDDGRVYPLPPTLGAFPLRSVRDYSGNLPVSWQEQNGVFIPMYQREALWLAFEAPDWKPCALKIGVGHVNALTGGAWDQSLHQDPQDYLVCPDQPWLDGFKTGTEVVRQFVAMPLGEGYTAEAQITGAEQVGGIQILVYDPKPGIFPDAPPPAPARGLEKAIAFQAAPSFEMGVGAGGQIRQKVYPDAHGIQTWEQAECGELFVYLVNSTQYQGITGEPPPPSPVDAQTYTRYGLPWFDLYDETLGDLSATETLARLRSVGEIDAQAGLPQAPEDTSVDIDQEQIRHIRPGDQERLVS